MSENYLPYLVHKNPDSSRGGRLYGYGEACDRSFVCAKTEISDQSSVWVSNVSNSLIVHSTLNEADVSDSVIIQTLVASAKISGSIVKCEGVLGRARVENSIILDRSRVAHNAVVRNSRFKRLTVKGNARLEWNNREIFDGAFGYITRGVWTRPPKVFRVSEDITVTEGVRGFAFVHCREYPIDFLLKIGNRLGRSQNWSAEQVKTVRRILHHLSKN